MRYSTLGRRNGRAIAWLLAGLLIGGAVGAGAMYVLKRGKAGIEGGPRLGKAGELALVPTDSLGFVHLRARDIWKSEHLEQFRRAIDKAGPDALKILDDSFVPSPSTLDRMTVVILKEQGAKANGGQPPVGFPRDRNPILPGNLGLPFDVPAEASGAVVILAFNAPFEAAKIRSTYMPAGVQKTDKDNGKELWLDRSPDGARDLGLYFPSDTVMVVGPAAGVEVFVAKQTKDGSQPAGPLSAALNIAAEGGRHMVAGINVRHFGSPEAKLFENAPNEFKAVEADLRALLKAEAVALGLTFADTGMKFDIRAAYASEADAREADKAARAVATHLRTQLDSPRKQMKAMLEGKPGGARPRPIRDLPEAVIGLFGTGAINLVEDNLANPPIKVEGNELVATFDNGSISGAYAGAAAVGVALLLPAVQKVREAAGRMQSSNNLKQIGIAMHSYHDSYGKFPAADGKHLPNAKGAGLSWRVHILPFIEQEQLYKQFKLDEPWDSPHNKALIEKMPNTYVSPLAMAPPGQTYYKAFVGNGALLDPGKGVSFLQVRDGTSNTIMAIEGGTPVVWTKPDDIAFDGKSVTPFDYRLAGNARINVLMADGSVRNIDLSRLSPETLKAAITRAAGEVMGLDFDNDGPAPFPFPKSKVDGPDPPPGKGGVPPPPKDPRPIKR